MPDAVDDIKTTLLQGQAQSDPSPLTTAQMLRENAWLKELVEAKDEIIRVRMNSMAEAVRLLQASADRQPSIAVVDTSVNSLKALHQEKFDSVQTQFKERDTRTEQTQRDTKTAVDAALKAQQEAFSEQNKSSALAISKSEAATNKSIDQIRDGITSNTKVSDDKISDLKDRLTAIENRTAGISAQRSESRDNTGLYAALAFGGIGLLVGIGTLAIGVMSNSSKIERSSMRDPPSISAPR